MRMDNFEVRLLEKSGQSKKLLDRLRTLEVFYWKFNGADRSELESLDQWASPQITKTDESPFAQGYRASTA